MVNEKSKTVSGQTRKPGKKNFLTSPYSLTWPDLEKGDNRSILDGIRSIFPTNGIKREKLEESFSCESPFVTWNMAKKALAIGVNSVTKSLEKDNLVLVLVCRSTKPAILTNHLMVLSATRSTPCCAVFGLSDVMGPLLGIKTVVACGFKKDITVSILKDLVEYIVCKIPPLPEEYLAIWYNNGHNNSMETVNMKDMPQTRENTTWLKQDPDLHSGPNDYRWQEKVGQGKKRRFDSSYVDTHIKTLLPRETPKIKKVKSVKTSKVKKVKSSKTDAIKKS